MTNKAPFMLACVTVFLTGTPAKAFDPLSEAAFQAQIVGKTLKYKRGGQVSFGMDGTLVGTFPAGPAFGSWYWDNGKVCSQISIGAQGYPQNCRTPEIEGNDIRFMQDSGKIFGEAVIE